jgi:hypothetical protein
MRLIGVYSNALGSADFAGKIAYSTNISCHGLARISFIKVTPFPGNHAEEAHDPGLADTIYLQDTCPPHRRSIVTPGDGREARRLPHRVLRRIAPDARFAARSWSRRSGRPCGVSYLARRSRMARSPDHCLCPRLPRRSVPRAANVLASRFLVIAWPRWTARFRTIAGGLGARGGRSVGRRWYE